MSAILSPIHKTMAQVLFALLLLMVPAVISTHGGAHASVADETQAAVDIVNEKVAPGDAKMAPIMTETNKTATWIIWVFWVTVPMILFGYLIAKGIIQANQNGIEAAKNTFIAVGVGVIFYFGVLLIFF